MKQNENEVSPDLKLTKISPGQINGRNVINVNLQNSKMAYINTMNVKATIKGITNSDIAYSYSNPRCKWHQIQILIYRCQLVIKVRRQGSQSL